MAQRAAARSKRPASFDSLAAGTELTLEDVLADRLPGPEAQAEQAERRARVWEALGKLTPAQRATVVGR
jgi:DNA-directed RNA polymerase specialized sigma24 family protein